MEHKRGVAGLGDGQGASCSPLASVERDSVHDILPGGILFRLSRRDGRFIWVPRKRAVPSRLPIQADHCTPCRPTGQLHRHDSNGGRSHPEQ